MHSLRIVLIVGFCLLAFTFKHNLLEFTHPTINSYQNVSRSSIMTIPDDYLLAMVAIHECINTCPQDAYYIITATWNRVLVNHGGYGNLKAQLLSSEFNGLIDQNFYFDNTDPKHIRCLKLARKAMREKSSFKAIGWYSKGANPQFISLVSSRVVKTKGTCHVFWK